MNVILFCRVTKFVYFEALVFGLLRKLSEEFHCEQKDAKHLFKQLMYLLLQHLPAPRRGPIFWCGDVTFLDQMLGRGEHQQLSDPHATYQANAALGVI